ncbi:MAG: alanyl-tRNA editing protein [Verrucomicrobia bacterium]|nr:alanyl-tRNA editing protein [Verrucomicrobiota bacterium]
MNELSELFNTARKVFWDNPYQQSLETKIVSIENNRALFEQTIAYSFSGGQESDQAYVNKLPILDSQKEGNLIYYNLPEGHGLLKEDGVTMVINWPRRYRLMRLHFAAELVLEIVTKKFQLQKVGAHIAEHKARIDFIFPEHISSLFEIILHDYNEIIQEDLPILTGFSDLILQRRFWEIEGFAKVPCGGTHVKSTKEVGFVHLKRARSGKGIERIEITLIDENYNL